ncbi:hypothetical protein EVG20_g8872 [Dentipellis fragilis]|uniref:Uncharacterized protein n=1 Tax=Dentipellis fragilis TaxID=205917 RepID=A0A4Y9Y2C3_9AGAM|nr:hypothetical protein EVG20_g8872 [Dentipellis fragilis]
MLGLLRSAGCVTRALLCPKKGCMRPPAGINPGHDGDIDTGIRDGDNSGVIAAQAVATYSTISAVSPVETYPSLFGSKPTREVVRKSMTGWRVERHVARTIPCFLLQASD